MRITNNMMAMNTHRQYAINNSGVTKSVEKLSSGYRVNRSADDAAGLAISEKMRAQIRGLTMASKNSQDAISLAQTAEGALQESHNVLQRMRELAVQSASDTNETSIDRNALDMEFKQLLQELDDTADKTSFNDQGLIDGTYSKYDVTMDFTGSTLNPTSLDPPTEIYMGHLESASAGTTPGPKTSIQIDVAVENGFLTLTVGTEKHILSQGQERVQFDSGMSMKFAVPVDYSTGNNAADIFGGTGDIKVTPTVDETGNEFVVQTGANKSDELHLNIDSMNSIALGVFGAHIANREEASNAIYTVDKAVKIVSTQRAELGALQNRLEHKIANLDTSAENLQSAESRIRDLDMAKEMTTFTKHNILSQASNAMLAQANSLPQGVLSLLR